MSHVAIAVHPLQAAAARLVCSHSPTVINQAPVLYKYSAPMVLEYAVILAPAGCFESYIKSGLELGAIPVPDS
jgi:hypothetical protein